MSSAALLAPAAPASVGAALAPAPTPLTPLQVLTRAQWAKADARDQWLDVRDTYYGPGRARRLREAKAKLDEAHAAFAEASRAFWASPEGQTYAAAQRAAGYLNQ